MTRLLRDEFIVEPQGSSFAVRSKDFRPVGEYLGALLQRPEYACFLRPQNGGGGTGGAPTTQAAPTTPAQPQPSGEPQSFLDMAMRAAQGSQPGVPAQASGGTVFGSDGKPQRLKAEAFGLRPTNPSHWTDRQRRA